MNINFKEYCEKEFAKFPKNSGKRIAIIEDKCPQDAKNFKKGIMQHCNKLRIEWDVIKVGTKDFEDYSLITYEEYSGAIVIETLEMNEAVAMCNVFSDMPQSYDLDNFMHNESDNVIKATLKAVELLEIDLRGKCITTIGSGLGFEFNNAINNSKNRPGMIQSINSTYNRSEANMLYRDSRYIFNFAKGKIFTPYNITQHTCIFDVGYSATKELKEFYKDTESVKIINVSGLNYLELFKKLFA
jgi:hypothetical protein